VLPSCGPHGFRQVRASELLDNFGGGPGMTLTSMLSRKGGDSVGLEGTVK